MIHALGFAEEVIRADLARLLSTAIEQSGPARCDVSRETGIHKDALRRTLAGSRSVSVGEALRILRAAGAPPRAHMFLFLSAGSDYAVDWLNSDLAKFFDNLVCELPAAFEQILGAQTLEVKPRWGRGTAHRIARLLGEHIDELERKDALLAKHI